MATGVSPPAIGELRAKIKEEVTDYLQAKVEELQAEGIEKVSLVGVEGRGPEEIVDLARRTTDNIVAMSTHGRSGIGRWVPGSVTDLEGGVATVKPLATLQDVYLVFGCLCKASLSEFPVNLANGTSPCRCADPGAHRS